MGGVQALYRSDTFRRRGRHRLVAGPLSLDNGDRPAELSLLEVFSGGRSNICVFDLVSTASLGHTPQAVFPLPSMSTWAAAHFIGVFMVGPAGRLRPQAVSSMPDSTSSERGP